MVNGRRHLFLDRSKMLLASAGREAHGFVFEDGFADRGDLLRGLAITIDYLGKAPSPESVSIDTGKTKIDDIRRTTHHGKQLSRSGRLRRNEEPHWLHAGFTK